MKTKKSAVSILCIILMIVNAVLVFVAAGMPKERESKYHFIYVLPHRDVTIMEDVEVEYTTGEEGNEETGTVILEAGSQYPLKGIYDEDTIWVSNIGIREVVAAIDSGRGLDQEIRYKVSISDLSDEDIEVLKSVAERQADGMKRYEEYEKSLKLWFLQPQYLLAGLLAAVFFTAFNYVIYERCKKTKIFSLILNIIAVPGLVWLIYYLSTHLIYCK